MQKCKKRKIAPPGSNLTAREPEVEFMIKEKKKRNVKDAYKM